MGARKERARERETSEGGARAYMPVLYAAMIAAHLGSPEIIKQQINSGTGSFKVLEFGAAVIR